MRGGSKSCVIRTVGKRKKCRLNQSFNGWECRFTKEKAGVRETFVREWWDVCPMLGEKQTLREPSVPYWLDT